MSHVLCYLKTMLLFGYKHYYLQYLMKINLNKIVRKSQPFINTGVRLVKAGNELKSGNIGKSWKDLESIYKSGDLNSMANVAKKVINNKKSALKKKDKLPVNKSKIKSKDKLIFDDIKPEKIVRKRKRNDDIENKSTQTMKNTVPDVQKNVTIPDIEDSYDLLELDDDYYS